MHIPLFTPYVFSECISAVMEDLVTSNNSLMQEMGKDNYSWGNAHLLMIILIEECLMLV